MANILITGCSSGFGEATARTLAQAGHTVFATLRDAGKRNAEAAKALQSSGIAHVVELDVGSDASVGRAVSEVAQKTDGRIDVLVNNAGRFSAGVQEAFTVDEVKSLFDTNVFGPLRMNRAVLPYMRKKRSGLIVTLSSIVGRVALPCLGTYAATKHAVEALFDAQREELKALGIELVLLQPGAFPTEVGSKGLYVSDAERAAEYGAVADIPQQMHEGLTQFFSSPQAPRVQDVAEAIKRVIDTPAGQRQPRIVVDVMTGDPIRTLNEAHETQRLALLKAYGMA